MVHFCFSLSNGTVRVSLHFHGTSPVCIDMLKICPSSISSFTSPKDLGYSSPIPGLLSVFSHLSSPTTFSFVNTILVNSFPQSKTTCLDPRMFPKSSSVNTRLKHLLYT